MTAKTPSTDDLSIGQRIRQLRRARDMSQTELAKALGITFQQLQKYEKGTNRVSAGRLQAIARVFDVPVAVLYDEPATPAAAVEPQTARLAKALDALPNEQLRSQAIGLIETLAKMSRPRRASAVDRRKECG